jgi:hypothetical protein
MPNKKRSGWPKLNICNRMDAMLTFTASQLDTAGTVP